MIKIDSTLANDVYKKIFTVSNDIKKIPTDVVKTKANLVIQEGKIYAFDFSILKSQVYGDIKFAKKDSEIEPIFKQRGFKFFIDTEELFQFDKGLREDKLDVTEIIIEDEGIHFKTSHPSFELKLPTIAEHYGSNGPLRDFKARLKEIYNEELLAESDFDIQEIKKEQWKKVFKVVVPLIGYGKEGQGYSLKDFLYTEDEGETSILLRPKDFINKNKSTKSKIKVYKDPSSDQTAYFTFSLDTTHYVIDAIYRTILV